MSIYLLSERKKLLAAERGPSGGCLAKRLYLRFVYRLRGVSDWFGVYELSEKTK